MTKAQETASLRAYIESLPSDSYLRPWLEEIEPAVIHDIRCDFPVSPTFQASKAEGERVILEAQETAKAIIAEATVKAEKLKQHAESWRQHVADALHSAERAIYA